MIDRKPFEQTVPWEVLKKLPSDGDSHGYKLIQLNNIKYQFSNGMGILFYQLEGWQLTKISYPNGDSIKWTERMNELHWVSE